MWPLQVCISTQTCMPPTSGQSGMMNAKHKQSSQLLGQAVLQLHIQYILLKSEGWHLLWNGVSKVPDPEGSNDIGTTYSECC